MCDRFNIQITETVHTDTELARATVLANEDAYDMINARCTAALSMAVEGILYTVEDLPYVDLSKPYWDEKLTDDVNIGPYRYFAVGDLNLTFYDYTSVLLFNKQIVEDNTIENPYQIVYDNRWTFDKYMERHGRHNRPERRQQARSKRHVRHHRHAQLCWLHFDACCGREERKQRRRQLSVYNLDSDENLSRFSTKCSR